MTDDIDRLKSEGYTISYVDTDMVRIMRLNDDAVKRIASRIREFLRNYVELKFDLINDYRIRPFDCCDDAWYRSLRDVYDFVSMEIGRRRETLNRKVAYVDAYGKVLLTYEPSEALQNSNDRTRVFYEYQGVRYSVRELSEIARNIGNDIGYDVLYARLKNDWDIEKALTTPKGKVE